MAIEAACYTLAVTSELSHAVTSDGWRIALHRYRAKGARRAHPVVCCHGLAANHLAFDVAPEVSLARHLAGLGYDVVALELRGHGRSDRASLRGPRRFGWAFDDYLMKDVPAAIGEVGGGGPVHWVGHSMGGLLLLAHLAGGARNIRSAVTVGSSLDYSGSGSGFRRLIPLRGLLNVLPAVPVHGVARAAGRFVGRVRTPYERFNVWSSNCEPRLWRRLCRRGFHPVSPPVMTQLATAFERGGMRSRDGRTRYLDGLRRADAPVLCLAGDRDAQCPPEAAQKTVDALASAELRVVGRQHGQRDHYGHFDLLIGRRAREEVFPQIADWLHRHD
jgi:pimeloyl-ACP methyl ester carboxylesterase